MITGDYDFLKNIASHNVCAKCKAPLEVAWLAKENSYALGCGQHGYIDVVTRQLSLTEEYKAGEELPGFIEDNVKKGMRRRAMTQDKQVIPFELGGIRPADLATGELLLPEQAQALVDYAHKYSLDPMRGHVCLMYGKPYITIDGYLFHAKKEGTPYTLSSRPLTDDERATYQIPEGAHAWISEVILNGKGRSFTGLGVLTQEEMTAKSTKNPNQLRSPVAAAYPWQLAQKRADWQSLRRAFPIGESEEIKE